jgi:hypothetical protein
MVVLVLLDKSVSSCAHVSKILSSTGIAHGRTKQKSLKLNRPHRLHNTPHASSGHLGLQLSHLQSPAYKHLSISFHRATLAQTPKREAGKQRVSNIRIEAVTDSAEATTEGTAGTRQRRGAMAALDLPRTPQNNYRIQHGAVHKFFL